jgi:hypothetical protein
MALPTPLLVRDRIVRRGLVGDYRFNERTGGTLYDWSGKGNHGTLGTGAAAPTWTSQGLSFDGGDYVTLPNLSDSTNQISVFCAVAAPAGQSFSGIVSHWDTSSLRAWLLAINDVAGKVGALVSDNGTTTAGHRKQYYTQSAFLTAASVWRYIGFTFDAQNLTIYSGGAAQDVTKTADDAITTIYSTSANVLIGGYYAVGVPTALSTETIAAVQIYNQGILPSEALQNYKYIKSALYPRGITII